MTIQTIIDSASSIEFDRRKVVAQSVSRSLRLKTAERASAQTWSMIVEPSSGLRWTQHRGTLEGIDYNDRVAEYTVSLANNAKMGYLTAYQGELTSNQRANIVITATTTASLTLAVLPPIGEQLTSRSNNYTAQAFSTTTSVTYNRAIDTGRTDFLIATADWDANFYGIQVGDTLSAATLITGGQTVSSITRNYIRLDSVDYTRIVMSSAPNASSTAGVNVTVTAAKTTSVTSSTVIFKAGDFIQPQNSRYPYTVVNTVLRGSNSTVTVTLNRNIISSEGVTLTGQKLNIGNSVTWRMVVVEMPTYSAVPYDRIQFNGSYKLIEKII